MLVVAASYARGRGRVVDAMDVVSIALESALSRAKGWKLFSFMHTYNNWGSGRRNRFGRIRLI